MRVAFQSFQDRNAVNVVPGRVRMSLELPQDVRQDLANRANDLVGENQEEG